MVADTAALGTNHVLATAIRIITVGVSAGAGGTGEIATGDGGSGRPAATPAAIIGRSTTGITQSGTIVRSGTGI